MHFLKFPCLLVILMRVVKSQIIECDWFKNDILCGDLCVERPGLCICGDYVFGFTDAIPPTNNTICCNSDPCVEQPNGNVKCEGKAQRVTDVCNHSCRQQGSYGNPSFMCEDQTACYEDVWTCNGIPRCSE